MLLEHPGVYVPELPEVETMVRGIRPHLIGRKLKHLTCCPCACRPLTITPPLPEIAERLVGATLTEIRRRAKRCVLIFSTGEAIVIEPRMTGLLLLSDPPDQEHLRVCWEFAGRREFNSLWFWDRRGLGTIRLYTARELETLLGHGLLGPDALEMSPDDWWERTRRTQRPIKVALLDQQLVAGIGNLYASEILHRARIHPEKPTSRLTRHEVAALAAETLAVLEEAIRYEGSTLGDGTYRNVLNQNGSYQNAHRVYDRAAETCPTCRSGTITRIVQAQRSTFFCPVCQPRRQRKNIRSSTVAGETQAEQDPANAF